ncbi:MAG: hypothetical protein R3C28_28185 [Pirellulaceae bacterium]
MLWLILIQFLYRLAFGLGLTMGLTSSKLVTSGFFRVHLWVLLGLNTFGTAVIYLLRLNFPNWQVMAAVTALTAFLSYVGAVFWLYEQAKPGRILIWLVTACNFGLALSLENQIGTSRPVWLNALEVLTSGSVIGFTFCAMLLGHWYLNTPTMQMLPLQRLVQGMLASTLVRAALCAFGFLLVFQNPELLQAGATSVGKFASAGLALRWLSGIVGLLVLAVMTWETLKIPNTQSATGILYVGVICVFLGELTSQLLSASLPYPL